MIRATSTSSRLSLLLDSYSYLPHSSAMSHSPSHWKNICCNPYNEPSHIVRKKSQLRLVTKRMCEKFPSILSGERICDDCRKKLAKTSPPQPSDSSTESERTDSPPTDQQFQVDICEPLMVVNQYLNTVGETPLTKRKLQSRKYSEQNRCTF